MDRFVGERELSKIVTKHIRLDLNRDVLFATVNSDNTSDHLRNNDHVSQVGFDSFGLLSIGGLTLGLSELLQQLDWCTLHSAAELSASTGTKQFHQVVVAQVEKLVKIDTAVRVLAESACLLLFFGIGHVEKSAVWRLKK